MKKEKPSVLPNPYRQSEWVIRAIRMEIKKSKSVSAVVIKVAVKSFIYSVASIYSLFSALTALDLVFGRCILQNTYHTTMWKKKQK